MERSIRINFGMLRAIMQQLYYCNSIKNESIIDISLRQEDIEEGRLCDCMVMTSISTEPASEERHVSTVTTTLEVFSDNENRPPRLTEQKCRDLKVT